jgi:multidrug efflux pump
MLMIEDRGDLGPVQLQRQGENLVAAANVTPTNPGIDVDGDPIPLRAETPEAAAAPPPTPAGRAWQVVREAFAGKGKGTPAVDGLASVFRANVPQVFLDVDRDACIV